MQTSTTYINITRRSARNSNVINVIKNKDAYCLNLKSRQDEKNQDQ